MTFSWFQLYLHNFFAFLAVRNPTTTVTFPIWLTKHIIQCFAGSLWSPLNPIKAFRPMTEDSGFLRKSTHYEYTRGTLGQLVGKLEMYLTSFGDLTLWLYFYQIIRWKLLVCYILLHRESTPAADSLKWLDLILEWEWEMRLERKAGMKNMKSHAWLRTLGFLL